MPTVNTAFIAGLTREITSIDRADIGSPAFFLTTIWCLFLVSTSSHYTYVHIYMAWACSAQ
jgi:hypothetical protein